MVNLIFWKFCRAELLWIFIVGLYNLEILVKFIIAVLCLPIVEVYETEIIQKICYRELGAKLLNQLLYNTYYKKAT
jgi:hypothetical protein